MTPETTIRYLALLRGINVGGKNLIRMADLQACFECLGLDAVTTYIQSGNVLFSSGEPGAALAPRIEAAVASTFGCPASVFLRTRKQMQAIVGRAPDGFGTDPSRYRYDVIFLKPPVTAAAAMKSVLTKPEVDQAHAGSGVLYFSRLISRASQSQLSRLVSLPIYQSMTIRNWNTTTALRRLMDGLDR
jgi:uncharacterized protein (DUF1697 family)